MRVLYHSGMRARAAIGFRWPGSSSYTSIRSQHQRGVSQLAVVVCFPLPSVFASFVAPLIPLRDPTKGFRDNFATFMLLLFVTSFLTIAGAMPQMRAAAAIPHSLYTNTDLVLVGFVGSVPLLGLAIVVATYWRYPVPFFWVLFAAPWLFSVMFGNAAVLWRHRSLVARPLLAYVPSVAIQLAQIVIYPAYSAVFEATGAQGQIALILLFPVIKFVLKKGIFALTRRMNRELSAEISVSSVEICSSMYQSIIMQTTPSLLATALVIGIDVLQGLYSVRKFMAHGSALPRLVDDVFKPVTQDDGGLHDFTTRTAVVFPSPAPKTAKRTVGQRGSCSQSITSTVAQAGDDQVKLTNTHALELLHTAETILLVEYIEVAVPLVNAIYLVFATQFASALFNPRLRMFYGNPDELRAATASVVLYTSLQALTLIVMGVAMQYRLKLSALTLMAFVLETHAWSLQGKLIPWLSVFFVFPIVHFGELLVSTFVWWCAETALTCT
jgi:hypothetical protein